jgi:hypothetical protein
MTILSPAPILTTSSLSRCSSPSSRSSSLGLWLLLSPQRSSCQTKPSSPRGRCTKWLLQTLILGPPLPLSCSHPSSSVVNSPQHFLLFIVAPWFALLPPRRSHLTSAGAGTASPWSRPSAPWPSTSTTTTSTLQPPPPTVTPPPPLL